jgi:hypothetical protein
MDDSDFAPQRREERKEKQEGLLNFAISFSFFTIFASLQCKIFSASLALLQ